MTHFRSKRWLWAFTSIACLVICGVWYSWGIAQGLTGNNLGDWFGVLTCIFTALAFLGLMMQIHLQRADLDATREVLDAQKREMEAQVAAMTAQAQATRDLYEQSEARAQRDHALRLVDAYLAWLSASREAWQGAVQYITAQNETIRLMRSIEAIKSHARQRAPGQKYQRIVQLDGQQEDLERVRAAAASWLQRTQQAVVAVAAAADLISALDISPELPDAKAWQGVVTQNSAHAAKQAWDAVESAAHTAFVRLKRWMPMLPD